MTTTNLAEFGYRELAMLKDLLSAMIEQGLPKDFWNDDVHPMMNQNSGNVFLTNSDYQTAMLNGDKLETWYYLSYEGHEGFADDLYFDFCNGNICEQDYEELADILERNGMDEEAEDVRKAMGEDGDEE